MERSTGTWSCWGKDLCPLFGMNSSLTVYSPLSSGLDLQTDYIFICYLHYEAKLCILCIVSGIRNRPKSVLSRNPQHCYCSLIFYAVLDFTNKYLNHCTAQNRSKSMRICGIRNSICGIQNSLWNPQTNDKTFVSLN